MVLNVSQQSTVLEVNKLADFNEIMSFRMHKEDAYKKKCTETFHLPKQ